MKQGKVRPRYVVNIKGIPGLDYIEYDGEQGLRIGPLVTLQSIAASPVIREKFGLLRTACNKIGTPQVRNMGTLGGNICNGGPSQDSLPPLLVLDTRLKLASTRGFRVVPIDKFFVAPFQTALDPAEILVEIQIPAPPSGSAGCYHWLTKLTEVDETLVGVAVLVTADSESAVCREIKLALGSVAPVPIRAVRAENVLNGKTIETGTIRLAANIAASEISPRSRARYRRHMTAVLVERAITDAWQKIKQSVE
jgi:CO/xanthine dehydrogenase FAD-binding subunit